MHDYFLSLLLGVIEGLTEFLPVSSTAHLRIFEALGGIDLSNGFWKMYSIVIQLGAILCLPIYFRSRIARFFSTFPRGEQEDRTWATHPLTLVMIAFFFTAIPAFLLTRVIGKHLESLWVMGWSLLIGGIVMWVVDAMFGPTDPSGLSNRSPSFQDVPDEMNQPNSARSWISRHWTERMEGMTTMQAVWIGICQIASAVFPGTSRSMSTISAGQLAGMSRPAALEFSFFLSMPTMGAAVAYELFRTFHPKHGAPLGTMPASAHEWLVLAVGFVVSFIVALAVVAWFMNWVRQRGFTPFAIYRIAVGIAVLVWVMRG